jgi:7-cyano-7-deazaguanine reductase
LKHLGKEQREAIQAEDLDTIECPTLLDEVVLESDEVTAMCPVTLQPDYYRVRIIVTPDTRIIESKSLKLYLASFRDKGIFGETLASEIAIAIHNAIKPYRVEVQVTQKARGGIEITSRAGLNAMRTVSGEVRREQ